MSLNIFDQSTNLKITSYTVLLTTLEVKWKKRTNTNITTCKTYLELCGNSEFSTQALIENCSRKSLSLQGKEKI